MRLSTEEERLGGTCDRRQQWKFLRKKCSGAVRFLVKRAERRGFNAVTKTKSGEQEAGGPADKKK